MNHRPHLRGPNVAGRAARLPRPPLARHADPELLALRAYDVGTCALGSAVHRLESVEPDTLLHAICRELLGDVIRAHPDLFPRLDGALRETLLLNALEWLVADGNTTDLGGALRGRAIDVVLAASGAAAPLTHDEQVWMQELARRELTLFRIGRFVRGRGLPLYDPIERARPPLWVAALPADRALIPDSICALRPLHLDGSWVLSLARFAFASSFFGVSVALALREDGTLCAPQPGEEPARAAHRLRWARSVTITRAWLDERLELLRPASARRSRARRARPPAPRRRRR